MANERFASVWDAIGMTPSDALNEMYSKDTPTPLQTLAAQIKALTYRDYLTFCDAIENACGPAGFEASVALIAAADALEVGE